MKTLGFREMHDDQVQAFVEFMQCSLDCAAMADPEIYEEMYEKVQDLVQLFGGQQLVTQTSLEL